MLEKNARIIWILAGIGIVMLIFMSPSEKKVPQIVINEVCSTNFSIICDSNGKGFDYIELINTSDEEIDMSALYLSDDLSELQKDCLGGIVVPPKGKVLYAADGNVMNLPDHLSFQINSEGETIYLSYRNGEICDVVSVPKLRYNQTYSREVDGVGDWVISTGTPMSDNSMASKIFAEELGRVECSLNGGFYLEPLEIEINRDDKADLRGDIYYTLDGSVPTLNSHLYSEPIKLEQGTNVLRTRLIEKSGMVGPIKSVTYFVGDIEKTSDVIISMMIEPDELLGEDGIYVNGPAYDAWIASGKKGDYVTPNWLYSGRQSEREVNIELFFEGEYVNQPAGIRINGGSTRWLEEKRFALYSREIYSGNRFFENTPFNRSTHSMVLRSGVVDAVVPQMVSDRNVTSASAANAVTYINGQYWYDFYLREKITADFIAEKYGLSKDNIVIMKNDKLQDGIDEDIALYDELWELISDETMAKEKKYKLLEQYIDVQSLMDYIAINVYVGNMDLTEQHNFVVWRTRTKENDEYGDTRWRWILDDLDGGEYVNATYNTFQDKVQHSYTIGEWETLKIIKENPEYKERFVTTFMDIVNNNFSESTVTPIMEKYGVDLGYNNKFYKERKHYIVPYLMEEFELSSDMVHIEIDVPTQKEGMVYVNTSCIRSEDDIWRGDYFKDYCITLEAVAAEGYRFKEWKGDISSQQETVELGLSKEQIKIIPVFEKE